MRTIVDIKIEKSSYLFNLFSMIEYFFFLKIINKRPLHSIINAYFHFDHLLISSKFQWTLSSCINHLPTALKKTSISFVFSSPNFPSKHNPFSKHTKKNNKTHNGHKSCTNHMKSSSDLMKRLSHKTPGFKIKFLLKIVKLPDCKLLNTWLKSTLEPKSLNLSKPSKN
jgi:hypothetical protein